MPALVHDGLATTVLHASQIADVLGLPPPAGGSPEQDGADAAAILEAWLRHLHDAGWDELLEPTPSRGRSLRNLTVNVFRPFELLPAAWLTGEFPWRPEDDHMQEQRLASQAGLLAFAGAAAGGWRSFLAETNFAGRDPAVESARGALQFSALVSFQRWHAAYHYRQVAQVLKVEPGVELDRFVLPLEVF